MANSSERIMQLSDKAKPYYDPTLPFHNWSHALEVRRDTRLIIEEASLDVQHLDLGMIGLAAAWHDAGHNHHAEHAEYQLSPEEYSIELARRAIGEHLTDREWRDFSVAILGTRMNEPREDFRAIALHYGDVFNMAHGPESYVDHTVRLWREHGSPNWDVWRGGALSVMERVSKESLEELPDIGVDPYGIFYNPVQRNMEHLERMSEPGVE